MDKKKREALVIVGVLAVVLAVTVIATIVVPKISKERVDEKNTKKTTETTYTSKETTTWEFQELEVITIGPEELNEIKEEFVLLKRQGMREIMLPSEYKLECETCTVSIQEMYFDEDTMDGCFHITISVNDDTVIDENWYNIDEEGVSFGKYIVEENGENVEKWRYNLVTKYFYYDLDDSLAGSSEVTDNVLHIYGWLKDDAEMDINDELIEGESIKCYILGYLFDVKLSEENPDNYNPKIFYVDAGIKYNKSLEISDGVIVTISPTSVLIEGKKELKELNVIYSEDEQFFIIDEYDLYNMNLYSVINKNSGKKCVLSHTLRFDEVKGFVLDGKKYFFKE